MHAGDSLLVVQHFNVLNVSFWCVQKFDFFWSDGDGVLVSGDRFSDGRKYEQVLSVARLKSIPNLVCFG